MNTAQPLIAELLAILTRPYDFIREHGPMGSHERMTAAFDMAQRVAKAQGDDEYTSWQAQEVPRCEAS